MSEPIYTLAHESAQGTRYLSTIASFCSGERFLGYFDLSRSCAMPLTYDQANQLQKHLKSTMPAHNIRVVFVPWNHAEPKEVPGDG